MKTNLLEVIYVLAMVRSHRTPHDKELIQWDVEYAKIEGRVKNLMTATTDAGQKVLTFNRIQYLNAIYC